MNKKAANLLKPEPNRNEVKKDLMGPSEPITAESARSNPGVILHAGPAPLSPPDPTAEVGDAEVIQLVKEISELSENLGSAKSNQRKSRAAITDMRLKLEAKLYDLHKQTVGVGRDGHWAGALRKLGISKTTANRHVNHHKHRLNGDSNSPTGAISEPTPADVHKLLKRFLPQMKRVVQPGELADLFLEEIRKAVESITIPAQTVCV